ncbi:MAG: hypothetical protein ABWY19_14875 [Marmoricola sp.]
MSESPPREPDDAAPPAGTSTPVRERGDGYMLNNVWVPRGKGPDRTPLTWSERLDARFGDRWRDHRFQAVAGGVLLVLVLVVVGATSGSGPARMPDAQRDFLSAVERGQTAVSEGNDLTLVTAARDRASQICPALDDGRVEDWVGTIKDVGTVVGGKQGHLTLALGHDVELRTWDRSSDDAQDHTLIDPNSDLYRDLADLGAGDRVRFSGSFRPRGASCLHETSLFAKNGMLTPGFVFRFTAVAPR